MKPTKIEIWYDTQDPHNHGWAWRSLAWDSRNNREREICSGPLDSRRADAGLRTLAPQARRSAGCAKTRVPVRIVS
jgi:hypothetical protein